MGLESEALAAFSCLAAGLAARGALRAARAFPLSSTGASLGAEALGAGAAEALAASDGGAMPAAVGAGSSSEPTGELGGCVTLVAAAGVWTGGLGHRAQAVAATATNPAPSAGSSQRVAGLGLTLSVSGRSVELRVDPGSGGMAPSKAVALLNRGRGGPLPVRRIAPDILADTGGSSTRETRLPESGANQLA